MAISGVLGRFRAACRVSPLLPLDRMLSSVLDATGSPAAARYFHAIQVRIQNWVDARYGHCLLSPDFAGATAVPFADPEAAPIWMCWLQGEHDMPPLIRELYRNVCDKRGRHPIHLLDLADIIDLRIIPDDIVAKFRRGTINPTFLSDILRVCLLEKFGGIWVDTTLLLRHPIPDMVLEVPCWNVKGLDGRFPDLPTVPYGTEWQSYFLAAQPHSLLFRMMRCLLFEYMKDFDYIADYFMTFYFARLIRAKSPTVGAEYALIPDNNEACELLDPYMRGYGPLSSLSPDYFRQSATYVYKLTRRRPYNDDDMSFIRQLADGPAS